MKSIIVLNILLLSTSLPAATWKKMSVTAPTITTGTAGTALTSAQCPTGYVFVPKNTTYTASDFCVAKYEMKNDGYGTPVSVAAGTPWAALDRPTARAKCQSLGSGYDMISNDQWQTIARNIAGVASNWSTGTLYSGELNRGHSDNDPANTLAASTDDTSGNCSGTNNTCSSSTWNSQRRTFNLSNGNVIWDFAGNAYEWVSNDSNVSNGTNAYASSVTDGSIRQTRYGAATASICGTPNGGSFCGMGGLYVDYNSGGVARGGFYGGDIATGVFAVTLQAPTSYTDTNAGFRCVFTH